MNKDVFISYKAEEFDEASWVKSVLEKNDISCWMAPDSIPGGSSYAAEISQAIRNCKVFVLILSEKAQLSKWVPKEVDQAINENKTIMPFMVENCKLQDDFNFYLTNVQRYAAYENRTAAVKKMIKEIKAIIAVSEDIFIPEEPAKEKEEGVVQTELPVEKDEKAEEKPIKEKPIKEKPVKKKVKKKLSAKIILKWAGIAAAALVLVMGISFVIHKSNTVEIAGKTYQKSETNLYFNDVLLTQADIINIAQFDELVGLHIENCEVDATDLSFIVKPTLKGLYLNGCGLSYGQLETIDLTGTDIENLNLAGNHLGNLNIIMPVADNLYNLDVTNTGISDISPLGECLKLWYLYAGDNEISDISPLSNCRSLNQLYIYKNQIADLTPLSLCTELSELDVSGNQLDSFSGLEPCIEIRYLYASDNQITSIDGLTNMTLLDDVYLNNNQITDISLLEKSANELDNLHVANNQITDISALKSCIYLEELDLAGNQLTSLEPLKNCLLLKGLSAPGNQITSAQPIEALENLEYLDLSNNQLTVLGEEQTLVFNSEYSCLNVSGNDIEELNISAADRFWTVNAAGNPLKDFQPLYDHNIQNLFVDYQDTIDFAALSEIECGEFYIIDCPLDRQVEVKELLGSHRTKFTAENSTGFSKDEHITLLWSGKF